ncbi:MAG: class I SAM-dependent methyltransferase, partial [Coprococcus comes]|nr:class I SAM-dependent methyltransferase [Coprococcus comes]
RFLALEEGISEDIAEGSCRFMVMDSETPEFADESFDVVISRNLTWTLPHADRAYEQWIRVLKKGGCLINADADYGADNFADTSSLPKSHVHNMVGNELMEECETIKQLMPISECRRPAWDVQALKYFDMEDVQADTELSNRLYKEKDEFYNPTSMFLVYGKKKR